ncbi:hypothetical protein P7C70_g351, partial [Phenoliferia sp. Uapishka_3]
MPRKTFIVGVGMTAFTRPRGEIDYPELAVEAATKVNNNCSTGSTALFLAKQMVEAGICECTMALGFEKMRPGSLGSNFDDRCPPLSKTVEMTAELAKGTSTGPFGISSSSPLPSLSKSTNLFILSRPNIRQRSRRMFVASPLKPSSLPPPPLIEFPHPPDISKTSATWTHVAKIASKNHLHSISNPYSQFRNGMTYEEVLADKPVTNYLTRAECCPTSDGAACAIIASEEFVRKWGLENQAVEIVGMSLKTDSVRLFEDRSAVELTGADMTRQAAKEAFRQAGIRPDQCCVVELHDCFAANELLVYDALGLCEPGKAGEMVDAGDNTYGGKYVINPSGGLESKGHPLGATGIGMAFYIVNQLRGWAGPLQAPEALPGVAEAKGKEAYGLAHNLGLGGACVVTVMKRPSFWKASGEDGRDRVGYNHAAECRRVTREDVEKVRSVKAFSEYAMVDI